jgi:protein-S-isoprenylcysteine O-methyltransferase Ste14
VRATRLPDLGSQGQGWFLIQVVLFVAIAMAGPLGPAWSGAPRVGGEATGAVLIVLGGLFALRGLIDLRSSLTPFPKPLPDAHLVVTGSYRLARHPIYGGLIMGAVGWGLATASPVALGLAATLTVFFDLKSRREEIWLTEQFADYAAYRSRTHRLLPWVY